MAPIEYTDGMIEAASTLIELQALRDELAELRREVSRLKPRTAAYIPASTSVADDARIHPTVKFFSSSTGPISIGSRTTITRGVELIGPVTIGSGCRIGLSNIIWSQTTIGNNVLIGPHVRIISDTHEIGGPEKRAAANKWPPIVIGDGTWIGAGATILGGVTIGEGCIVAAGAVVVKDVPANTSVGGVPARPIRTLPEG